MRGFCLQLQGFGLIGILHFRLEEEESVPLYTYEYPSDAIQGSDLKRINGLLKEFSPNAQPLSLAELKEILSVSYMAVLRDGRKAIVGMATLVTYRKPTGCVGVIEDVIVTAQCRGRGGGRQLLRCLIGNARQMRLKHLELTSNPKRVEARALYQSLGFLLRDTGCFRLQL